MISENARIAKGAVIVGEVAIGDYSSVWYNAVIRGDVDKIINWQLFKYPRLLCCSLL